MSVVAVKVSEVLVGVAKRLHAQSVAVWRATGAYSAGERAITLKALPSSPDEAVAVSVYDVEDDLRLPHVLVYVQLRFRGSDASRTSVDDFADAAFSALHGARFAAGDRSVQQCRRLSVAPLGGDDNARQERADNYELVLSR